LGRSFIALRYTADSSRKKSCYRLRVVDTRQAPADRTLKIDTLVIEQLLARDVQLERSHQVQESYMSRELLISNWPPRFRQVLCVTDYSEKRMEFI
jgi:hypothetical protein